MKLIKKYKYFLLIFVVFISLSFTMNTSSKFVSKLEQKNISVEIAKWDVSVETPSNSVLNLISGNNSVSQNYKLKLINTSEVASTCSLIISNVPTGISVSINGENPISESNNQIIINNFSNFNANDVNSIKEYDLTFIAPIEMEELSNHELNIDVIFEQKQI